MFFKKLKNVFKDDPPKDGDKSSSSKSTSKQQQQQPQQGPTTKSSLQIPEESKARAQTMNEHDFEDLIARDPRIPTRDATKPQRQSARQGVESTDQQLQDLHRLHQQYTKPTGPPQRSAPNFMADLMEMRGQEAGFEADDHNHENEDFFQSYDRKPKETMPSMTTRSGQETVITQADNNRLAQSTRNNTTKVITQPVPAMTAEATQQAKPGEKSQANVAPKIEPVSPPTSTQQQISQQATQPPVRPPPVRPPTQAPVSYPKAEPVKPQSTTGSTFPRVEPVKPSTPAPTILQQVQDKIPQDKPASVQQQNTKATAPTSQPIGRSQITRNRMSRALDLDMDEEDGDDDVNFTRSRGKDGQSAALERIMEKRQRGSMLPQKRPTLDQGSAEVKSMTVIPEETQRSTSFVGATETVQLPQNPTAQQPVVKVQPSSSTPDSSKDTPLTHYATTILNRSTPNHPTPQDDPPENQTDPDMAEPNFVDFSMKRAEVARMTTERRQAVRKNVMAPSSRLQQQKQEELERNSSDSDLTDKKFEDNISIDSDEIEMSLQKQDARSKLVLEHGKSWIEDSQETQEVPLKEDQSNLFQEYFQMNQGGLDDGDAADTERDEEDFLKMITLNENMFRQYGEKKLKDQRNLSMQSAKSLQKFKDNASSQSVVAEPQLLRYTKQQQNQQETCVAISNHTLLVGTQSGHLYAFNTQSEKLLGVNHQEGKDFQDNAVTSIDIHARRPDYCIVGYEKGQIALLNLASIGKTLKLIKDHHKVAVVSLKFCDWSKEKPHLVAKGAQHSCKDCMDVKSWMFLSCDKSGKVVQNTVTNVAFGAMYANDFVFCDPSKTMSEDSLYQVLCPRMSSRERPLDAELDNVTLVAMGNSDHVVLLITNEKSRIERLIVDKPKRYPSQNMDDVMPVMSQLPLLAWGFGKTPRYNFQTFPLLAIAWGPIIQLVVFKDVNSSQENSNFELDGHYIIAPEKQKGTRTHNGLDTQIQSLHFLDDSLLIAVTSNQEIRVMSTQKFKEKDFEPPAYLEEVNFSKIEDSRCKMMPIGSQITDSQMEIEMERKFGLQHPLFKSKFNVIPVESQQSQSVQDDQIVSLTTGGVFLSHHLNWLESLGDTDNSAVSGNWIEIFAKALEIYTGKVKGLRMKDCDDERKDNMRDQLKQMIDKQVVQIITQWKSRAETMQKSGKMNQIQVQDDLNSKFQTLIRIVIEFCVEIQEPVFLFDTLLKVFHIEGKSMLFAEELKPYILSGHFAECVISEGILSEQILKHHQKHYSESYAQLQNGVRGESIPAAVSPAENFEKILINFRFDSCSKEYKLELIDYCRTYGLTSALMYMCLNCYGEQGPLQALTQLKDFYLDTFTNEAMGESVVQREDLQALYTMPANYYDRILLERSSCYLGLKLLASARQFLLGKKFPRGFFSTQEWHVLCHDITELLTQEDLIQLLTEIDPQAYFQIVSIVFSNPSQQFKFIEQGRPAQAACYNQVELISVSHNMIVQRISTYFKQQSQTTDPSHIHYLCFIASIAGSYEKQQLYQELYFDVALELLNHSEMLLDYNKQMLKRKHTKEVLLNRLSKLAHTSSSTSSQSNATTSDKESRDYFLLSESMLLMLIERSRSVLLRSKPSLTKMLKACESTHFHNVKLVLYELNDDYLKCLQLFMEHNAKYGSEQMQEAVTWRGRQDGFKWIQEKFVRLEALAIETKGEVQKSQLQNFQKEVLNQALYLVKQHNLNTIKLCDAVFKSAHLEFLDQMKDYKQLQLTYIQQLLELKRADIKQSLISSGQPGQTQATYAFQKQRSTSHENQKWQQILSLHIRLICELQPERVTPEIEKVIKDNFYPMEECLKICVEFKQVEASALLNKKIGNYQNAITLYLQLLKNGINYDRLKKELFYLDKEQKRHVDKERQSLFAENQARFRQALKGDSDQLKSLLAQTVNQNQKTVIVSQYKDRRGDLYNVWVEKFGKNIELLDRSLDKMQNICKSHPKEVLIQNEESWQTILTFLFSVLFHPSLRKKSYCKRHLKLKMVEFCRCILPYVPFSKIIYAASGLTKTLRFKAVKELVNDVFADKSQEYEMCENAKVTQQRDLIILQSAVQQINCGGVNFGYESLVCGLCEQLVTSQGHFKSQLNPDGSQTAGDGDSEIFDCSSGDSSVQGVGGLVNHTFHGKCLRKFAQEELDKDRARKATKDVDLAQLFRCPVCYPKNQSIGSTEAKKPVSKDDHSTHHDSNSDSDASSRSSKSGNQKTDEAVPQMQQNFLAKKEMSASAKKALHREKQMKRFEESIMVQETLTRGDFIM